MASSLSSKTAIRASPRASGGVTTGSLPQQPPVYGNGLRSAPAARRIPNGSRPIPPVGPAYATFRQRAANGQYAANSRAIAKILALSGR